MTHTSETNPGCFGILLQALGINHQKQIAPLVPLVPPDLPYRIRDDFLSPAEKSFFHILHKIAANQLVICPKVRLGDIFFVARPNENFKYINKISMRHVDFLLCHPQSLQPLLGIELDDGSHKKPKAKEKDEFKNQVFQEAGLPLLRIPARKTYDPCELRSQIANTFIGSGAGSVTTPPVEKETNGEVVPVCPKCGVQMVIRVAKKGAHKGQEFYGCPNFPSCRQVITIA